VRRDYYAGRVAVISGAASGIGRALAVALSSRGAQLVLWDRDIEGLAVTAKTCKQAGAQVRTDVIDVTDRTSLVDAAARAHAELGRIDVVLCMAGVIHTGDVLVSDPVDLEHVIHVNVCGTVNTVTALLRYVVESDAGHILTTSSGFGLMAAPRYSAYSASKFAIRGFTSALRQELTLDGHSVRATCVVPGGVRTPIIRNGRFADGVDRESVIAGFDTRVARISPQRAAEVILRELPRGRAQIMIGSDARLLDAVARLGGGCYQSLVPWLLRRRGHAKSH